MKRENKIKSTIHDLDKYELRKLLSILLHKTLVNKGFCSSKVY